MMLRADVGLLPFHWCTHINSTLANKLFEYMALRLPIVASDVPPMARVLGETGAGITFRAGDAESLANAIEAVAGDRERAARMGKAGADAVRSRYNWGVDAERLLRCIEAAEAYRG